MLTAFGILCLLGGAGTLREFSPRLDRRGLILTIIGLGEYLGGAFCFAKGVFG